MNSEGAELTRVRAEFSRQASSFSRAFERRDRHSIEQIAKSLATTPQMRVLDLACGPGIVSVELAARAGELIGVDATDAMLERARGRCTARGVANARFELADAEHLPFDDAAFDAAACRLAIHHFPRPASVLAELVRVLRPGGRLALADIIASHEPDEAALHNALEQLRDPSHVAMFPAATLVEIVETAGLRIASTETWTAAREFEEWMSVVAAPERNASLRCVMAALADAGIGAGIGLRRLGASLVFDHRWLLVVAEKPIEGLA